LIDAGMTMNFGEFELALFSPDMSSETKNLVPPSETEFRGKAWYCDQEMRQDTSLLFITIYEKDSCRKTQVEDISAGKLPTTHLSI
jgi:hypothetical protein